MLLKISLVASGVIESIERSSLFVGTSPFRTPDAATLLIETVTVFERSLSLTVSVPEVLNPACVSVNACESEFVLWTEIDGVSLAPVMVTLMS